MNFLSPDYLIWLNRYILLRSGGFFIAADDNVANRGSLEYLVEAVPGAWYGRELHEGLFHKAAAYAYYIIRDHVFHDGNKRTGIQAAVLFLLANGRRVVAATDQDIVDFALRTAEGSLTLDDLAEWLESVCEPRLDA